ncbi:glycoside hydrolase superfamily [Gautieria morchelliformis]|nr:glycoside hydrolase superfamily [Gautieria morchelliformis]
MYRLSTFTFHAHAELAGILLWSQEYRCLYYRPYYCLVPRPHILYVVEVTSIDSKKYTLVKRYSEFSGLHDALGFSSGTLPPKRILATTFLPSAWVDDRLIEERKAGLNAYIKAVLRDVRWRTDSALVEFFAPSSIGASRKFNLEDALPSTLSRKGAEAIMAAASLTAAAYYPDWSVNSNPPESIDYSKFDLLYFAFATPNSSSGISWDAGGQAILQRLVTSARNSGQGTKVALSIGGWGGSTSFSQAVSSSGNRTTFVNACVDAVNTYGLDGIDIDWEYPNLPGAGNPFSPSDAANLLSFFTQLRAALGSSKIISAAVTDLPWIGSNGQPLTDVSAYAAQLTTANIMNYDVWGASSMPGPNAPLSDACHNSQQPQANAAAALAQWTAAGFPAQQLLLGLPLYGYVSNSTQTTLSHIARPPTGFTMSQHKQRVLNNEDSNQAQGLTTVPNFLNGNHARTRVLPTGAAATALGDLSAYWGQQIPFNQLLQLGALVKNSDGTYGQANGYTEGWDNCSDTPFLFDTSRSTVVTYDDTYSLGDKAAFAQQNGMGGCFTWSLDQDDGVSLQNVIRSKLGK